MLQRAGGSLAGVEDGEGGRLLEGRRGGGGGGGVGWTGACGICGWVREGWMES